MGRSFPLLVLVLGIAGALGCGDANFGEIRDVNSDTDDNTNDETNDQPFPTGPFGTPTLALGLEGGDTDDPTLTADLMEIVFNRRPLAGGDGLLYSATRQTPTSAWENIEPIDELNALGPTSNPELSADGLTMYFCYHNDQWKIWRTTRVTRQSPWESPEPVLALTSPKSDYPSTVVNNGLLMFVASSKSGDTWLYESTRGTLADLWTTPVALEELNILDIDSGSPHSSADGLRLYFDSDRADSVGQDDLFQAERSGLLAAFATPTPIPGVNTVGEESDPWMSEDGRYIMFVRDNGDANQRQLYEARR